ncbi:MULTISPECIES: hypothetical protein [unclassified Caballeronia]|jgi:hypothetical protein|uniref:hypothetical protein n=1 Tax=unclassified Caballeronia TaxID=2646786 RepID=UPI00286273E5|nr:MULTISPECIES: hypothetical protein [unclassified Caballeronia]MDR5752545.1 hypothetical protein [Caballeronia sp. LZ024]MDR5841701.1 hypothetical protein [Caballeronia sp. LZ031]
MKHAEAQSRVLARMEQTREEFVRARPRDVSTVRTRAWSAAANVGPWLLRTPNAALVSALLIGLVVLGPRRALQTALQAGLSTWTTRAVGTLANSTMR